MIANQEVWIKKIQAEIEAKRLVCVTGTGVSIASVKPEFQQFSGWSGLLLNGLERCLSYDPSLSKKVSHYKGLLEEHDLMAVAQFVENQLLKERNGGTGAMLDWFKDTIGRMQALEPAPILEALKQLQVRYATTNYDALLDEHLGYAPITWQDQNKILEAFKPGVCEKVVLHLHGFWDKPETAYLGVGSYNSHLGDQYANALKQSLTINSTLLFVGCGPSGLDDPDFQLLLNWMRETLCNTTQQHYVLVLEQDFEAFKNVVAGANIQPVVYGANPETRTEDLAAFLSALVPQSSRDRQPLTTTSEQQYQTGKWAVSLERYKLWAKEVHSTIKNYWVATTPGTESHVSNHR